MKKAFILGISGQDGFYLSRFLLERDYEKISQMVSKIYDIETEKIYSKGRRKVQVEARDLLCYWPVRELGISCTDLAKQLEMSQPGVGYAVNRGEKIAKEHNYELF